MLAVLVTVVAQSGSKIISHKTQLVKHPVSKDLCATLYTVAKILKGIMD